VSDQYEAIVIGASTGGTEAICRILEALPSDYPLPIFAVQHLHPLQDKATIIGFNEKCGLVIKEAEEKEEIKSGRVYLAPPNYHLLIEDDYTFTFSIDAKINFARPSIDVLFESALDVYGKRLIGIILTGANNDGAKGLRLISNQGGMTIVQDPESAEAPAMPQAAIAGTQVDHVLPPKKIGHLLAKLR
jgi:two-component system chemotaxis response regulator CheB